MVGEKIPHIDCPFCGESLSYVGTEITTVGVKIIMHCENTEDCDEGSEKTFFAYINESDIEY